MPEGFNRNHTGIGKHYRNHRYLKRQPECQEHFHYEIKIIADISHYPDTFRRDRGEKSENDWKYYEECKYDSRIKQDDADYQ